GKRILLQVFFCFMGLNQQTSVCRVEHQNTFHKNRDVTVEVGNISFGDADKAPCVIINGESHALSIKDGHTINGPRNNGGRQKAAEEEKLFGSFFYK
ncbi:MAG: hypothetical protein MJ096_06680, partial [Clostridia bacterium]|nr:hypothetical protein [Clostridia bacterium]